MSDLKTSFSSLFLSHVAGNLLRITDFSVLLDTCPRGLSPIVPSFRSYKPSNTLWCTEWSLLKKKINKLGLIWCFFCLLLFLTAASFFHQPIYRLIGWWFGSIMRLKSDWVEPNSVTSFIMDVPVWFDGAWCHIQWRISAVPMKSLRDWWWDDFCRGSASG